MLVDNIHGCYSPFRTIECIPSALYSWIAPAHLLFFLSMIFLWWCEVSCLQSSDRIFSSSLLSGPWTKSLSEQHGDGAFLFPPEVTVSFYPLGSSPLLGSPIFPQSCPLVLAGLKLPPLQSLVYIFVSSWCPFVLSSGPADTWSELTSWAPCSGLWWPVTWAAATFQEFLNEQGLLKYQSWLQQQRWGFMSCDIFICRSFSMSNFCLICVPTASLLFACPAYCAPDHWYFRECQRSRKPGISYVDLLWDSWLGSEPLIAACYFPDPTHLSCSANIVA